MFFSKQACLQLSQNTFDWQLLGLYQLYTRIFSFLKDVHRAFFVNGAWVLHLVRSMAPCLSSNCVFDYWSVFSSYYLFSIYRGSSPFFLYCSVLNLLHPRIVQLSMQYYKEAFIFVPLRHKSFEGLSNSALSLTSRHFVKQNHWLWRCWIPENVSEKFGNSDVHYYQTAISKHAYYVFNQGLA